jgi:hypothetical protein
MGIGLVLLGWAVVGTILACVGALVMGGVSGWLTRGAQKGRSRVVFGAILFPFGCLVWAGLLFVVQAVANGAMHRDAGLGDTWNCPLPNGYMLMMIDVTDQGWIYNPKTQPGDGVGEQEDAVSGVRMVQVSGKYILGSLDSNSFKHLGQETDEVDSYFLMDTQTGKRADFPSSEALGRAAAQLGVKLSLENIYVVYSRYRFTWFDGIIGLLLCALPAGYLLVLVRRIMQIRRSRGAAGTVVVAAC